MKILIRKKGGKGSGNWGHAGRPGSVGGSVPRSHSMSIRTGSTWKKRYEAKTGRKPPMGNMDDIREVIEYAPETQSRLLDNSSQIPRGKYGRGWFINTDGKLLNVTSEFGGGTNDHVGFVAASDNPEDLGLSVGQVSKFRKLSNKLFGEDGQSWNDRYEDAWNDSYVELWDSISDAGNVRVREFITKGRPTVAVDLLNRTATREDLRAIQDYILSNKIPDVSKSKGSYIISSEGYAVEASWNDIMLANDWRDLKLPGSKECKTVRILLRLTNFGGRRQPWKLRLG